MIDVSELVVRCQQFLMDENEQAYSEAQIRTQLALEASKLASQRILGQVVLAQAVANVHTYPLDVMSVLITSALATSATVTTITQSSLDFVTLGVVAGDRIRDLTDGSVGIVTTVATTVLTASGGFLGGVTNTPAANDLFVVEHPITANRVVEVGHVYYNGTCLAKTTEHTLDTRRPGWETWTGEPRYWMADGEKVISTIRLVPAPTRTGSSAPTFPMNPLSMDWHDNLMVFLFEDAKAEGVTDTGLLDVHDDIAVFQTVAQLAGRQTEYENYPQALLMPTLAAMWMQASEGVDEA